MKGSMRFDEPILITRPLLPKLDDYKKELEAVWETQWLTNKGQKHEVFEEAIKKYLNAPNLSLFNNGTIALLIALKALRLSGEVITTPFTFPATVHALEWLGLTPVFADVETETGNIDPEKIEQLIGPKTSAILAVHVYGTPCKVKKLEKIAKYHNIKLIFDAAHAFGTQVHNKAIAEYGDISMFSFHATKLFHSAEGGAVVYSDNSLGNRIELLKNFGIKNEDEVVASGINGKMNELQAAMGLAVLPLVDRERDKRKKIKERYIKLLSEIDGINVVNDDISDNSSFQYFVIRINEQNFGASRDEVYERLKDFNVFARKYFYPLCSDYPAYSQLASSRNLPIARKLVREVLSLPFYGSLTLSQIEQIVKIIKTFKR